jgi:hypothetical protein
MRKENDHLIIERRETFRPIADLPPDAVDL